MRRQPVVGHRDRRELVGQALHHVVVAVQEGQPARLRLFDDADLHPVDQRQPPAGELPRDGLRAGIVGRRLLVVGIVAVVRVALENDLGAASPLREAKRTAAHRMLHRLVRVGLDHLARHGAHDCAVGKEIRKARRRLRQPHFEAVAIERAKALDLGVVRERQLVGDRLAAQFGQAEDPGVLELEQIRALVLRVVVALDGIDVVGRGQLPALALERRVVGKEDAWPDAKDEALVIVAHLGQARRGLRLEQHRARQIVVGQRRLEDVGRHRARIQVRYLRRVEPGLGNRKGITQDLQGLRRLIRQRLYRRLGECAAAGQRQACGQGQQQGRCHGSGV